MTLKQVLDLFDDAKRYIDTGFRTDWDNYFKVYKGHRVIRNYEGISEPINREAHTIIETLVSNIASGYPEFQFVATNEEQERDTEVLNEMLGYYMECNQMGLKNQEWVREMLLYGTGVLYVEWREGKPFIANVPLRDFFFDPTSTGIVQTLNPAKWAGYEYLADIEDMKAQKIYDPEEDKMVPRYDMAGVQPGQKPKGGGEESDANSMDKEFKDLFKGSTLGDKATEHQVHVIKMHHLPTGRIYEVANRKKIIFNKPTWCQREEVTRTIQVEVPMEDGTFEAIDVEQTLDEIKPFLPFAVLRDYVDSSQFLGDGEMALLMGDAELLNDYEAMDVDNNAYQNTPMYWIDPAFADLAPEIETIPGAVYPIPRNAMGALERPQLSNDLDNKKERIMERMRRATAADEAVQGVAQAKSRTTATEVSTQLQQAQMRFSTKINNLESEGYAQLGMLIFKMVQVFVTKKTAMRIVGKNGVYFKDFDPWEFNGEYQAHVKLRTTIQREQLEQGMKRDQMYQILSQRPHFNPVEVDRWLMKQIDPNMDDEKFNALLAPPQEEDPVDEREYLTISYKDATPWTKYQMEKKLGLDPDPSHIGEQEINMLEQANRGADLMDPTTDVDGNLIPGMENVINPQPAEAPEGMPQPAGAAV